MAVTTSFSQTQRTKPNTQDKELGKVSWYRNYEVATAKAKASGKAVLILFQEVPGCATCRNYGHNVLSNPLLVEAIENLFVPLAIFNNRKGHDQAVLQRFGEPSWNNPVVRIVNDKGVGLSKRVAGNYSALGLYQAMYNALLEQNKTIPGYMKILGEELSFNSGQSQLESAYFKMYCFWSGEQHLGKAKGVLETQAGFMNGHEVVKVTYDPKSISYSALAKHAQTGNCAATPYHKGYSPSDRDHLFYLKRSDYQYLPLTALQKTKINSALGARQSAITYLSPKQLVWLGNIQDTNKKYPSLTEANISEAWASFE